MKERPIPFSAPMVRAIQAGTKTQTRRIVKPAGWNPASNEYAGLTAIKAHGDPRIGLQAYFWHPESATSHGVRCPYGQPGDRLWVRETWAPGDEMVFGVAKDDPETVLYRADQAALHWDGKAMSTPMDTYAFNWSAVRWKPSIHMFRWASRLILEVKSVRVQRLQEISASDCWAEGIPGAPPEGVHADRFDEFVRWSDGVMREHPAPAYRALWEQINGPESWAANPWVWVIEFRRA